MIQLPDKVYAKLQELLRAVRDTSDHLDRHGAKDDYFAKVAAMKRLQHEYDEIATKGGVE